MVFDLEVKSMYIFKEVGHWMNEKKSWQSIPSFE